MNAALPETVTGVQGRDGGARGAAPVAATSPASGERGPPGRTRRAVGASYPPGRRSQQPPAPSSPPQQLAIRTSLYSRGERLSGLPQVTAQAIGF